MIIHVEHHYEISVNPTASLFLGVGSWFYYKYHGIDYCDL